MDLIKIHDGYIYTKGKTPIMKKTQDQTWRDVMVDHVKEGVDHAGILNDTIGFIDTDTYEDSCALLEWLKTLETKPPLLQTDKGYHAYFNIPRGYEKDLNGYITPIGIRVDWRVGSNNCGLDCLCVSGKQRQFIHAGELYELPRTMLPIYKADKGLVGLKEGGRDVALFNHFNELIKHGMDVSEFRVYGELINKFILGKPYEDMAKFYQEKQYKKLIEKLNNRENKLQIADFVNLLLDKYDFMVLDGKLHYYENGIYKYDTKTLERELILIDGNITMNKRKEVLANITMMLDVDGERSPYHYIGFNNGILNINTMELLPYSPNIVITKKLPINWNPNSNSNVLTNVMNRITCRDAELEIALYEMIGYAMLDTCKYNRAFLLVGDGSNGKSIFLDMVRRLLGEYSPLSLQELHERFSRIMLYNKFANIHDDIGSIYAKDTELFKCLTDGAILKAEQKGQPAFNFHTTATLIFACNNLPRLGNGTDKFAIMRRMQIIPFNATFRSTDADYDPDIKEKLHQPCILESLAVRAVLAIKNVLEITKDFVYVDSRERSDYENTLEPYKEILENLEMNGTTKEVYLRFRFQCMELGMQPMNKNTFYRELYKIGWDRKQIMRNGRRFYVFEKRT